MNRSIERKSSAAAEEGTQAHELLEDHLAGRKNLADQPNSEMVDHLWGCADWIQSQVEKRDGVLHCEVRVDFGEKFGFVDLTGTSDIVIVSEDSILIADLKYGFGQVEVQNNTQLLTYLVGAVHLFGPRPNYEIAVLQPRGHHPDGPIRTCYVTPEELTEFEDSLNRAITLNYNNGQLVVGDHCRHYCPALGVCPAVAKASIERFKMTPIDDPGIDLDSVARELPLIKSWLTAIEAKLLENLEAGSEYSNVKLVPKRATRKWSEDVDIVDILTNFASLDVVAPRVPLSPSQAEKVLGKSTFRKSLAEIVVSESSGMTLGYVTQLTEGN
jgi:hypothetical protein